MRSTPHCRAANAAASAGARQASFGHSLWMFKFRWIWRQGEHIAMRPTLSSDRGRPARVPSLMRKERARRPRSQDRVGAAHDVEDFGARLCVDRKSTRLNSSHQIISYAVFSFKKKKNHTNNNLRSHQP